MNTKIEELAKQAFDTIAPDDKEWFKTYSTKLTELIVKECARIADAAEDPDFISSDILSNFGVEE